MLFIQRGARDFFRRFGIACHLRVAGVIMVGCAGQEADQSKEEEGGEQRDDDFYAAQNHLGHLLLLERESIDLLQPFFRLRREENSDDRADGEKEDRKTRARKKVEHAGNRANRDCCDGEDFRNVFAGEFFHLLD